MTELMIWGSLIMSTFFMIASVYCQFAGKPVEIQVLLDCFAVLTGAPTVILSIIFFGVLFYDLSKIEVKK